MQILLRSKMYFHVSIGNKHYQCYGKYIPNETKIFDEQNLPWMNAENENLITAKNEVFKNHFKNNRNRYYTYKYKAGVTLSI